MAQQRLLGLLHLGRKFGFQLKVTTVHKADFNCVLPLQLRLQHRVAIVQMLQTYVTRVILLFLLFQIIIMHFSRRVLERIFNNLYFINLPWVLLELALGK
jgi:hypothetical protein